MDRKHNGKSKERDARLAVRGNLELSGLAFLIFVVFEGLMVSSILSDSGWAVLFGPMISFWPLLISFILSLVAVIRYAKNKIPRTNLARVFYILNWITIIALVINFLGFLFWL